MPIGACKFGVGSRAGTAFPLGSYHSVATRSPETFFPSHGPGAPLSGWPGMEEPLGRLRGWALFEDPSHHCGTRNHERMERQTQERFKIFLLHGANPETETQRDMTPVRSHRKSAVSDPKLETRLKTGASLLLLGVCFKFLCPSQEPLGQLFDEFRILRIWEESSVCVLAQPQWLWSKAR